ncbi:MAG: D-alanyl-D-alanine carboxypeptidase, partial [Pseudomonadota bacterium]
MTARGLARIVPPMEPGRISPGAPRRRAVLLAGLASLLPVAACAAAPETATRPLPRPAPRAGSQAVIAEFGLTAETSFALADAGTGELLDVHQPDIARPPASVIKAVTALYALDRLGPAHRFATRLLATGPVAGGVLEGDLVLAGGGDPALDTDALAALRADLLAAGIRRVAGRFLIDESLQPLITQIDPEQPPHVGYNPSVGALNLNFNRVFFEWSGTGAARETT